MVGEAALAATVAVVAVYVTYEVGKEIITFAKSKAIPQSEPNIKGQGRERIQKKRKNPNWVDRSNKPVDRPIRPKKHTPGRDHRKY